MAKLCLQNCACTPSTGGFCFAQVSKSDVLLSTIYVRNSNKIGCEQSLAGSCFGAVLNKPVVSACEIPGQGITIFLHVPCLPVVTCL